MKTKAFYFLSFILVSVLFVNWSSSTPPVMAVEIRLRAAYEIDHLGPVCEELNRRGTPCRFVLQKPTTWYLSSAKAAAKMELYEALKSILDSRSLPYSDVPDRRAIAAITTQAVTELKPYRHLKFKFGYGAGSLKVSFHYTAKKHEGFDAFLIHGESEREGYSAFMSPDQLIVVGIPKYDPYFRNQPSQTAIREKLGLPTDKPIITYIPTWCEHTSVESFHEAMRKLADSYTVVIKPHPHTVSNNYKTGHLDLLKELSPYVMDGNQSLIDAVVVADLLITDTKSGSTTESLFVTEGNTPWIGLTRVDPSAYYDQVRAAGPILSDPATLQTEVVQILHSDPYTSPRKALGKWCYSDLQGDASEQAASAIQQMIQNHLES